MITVVLAAEIADRLWQRDPIAFRFICLACIDHGMTLLDRIQQRAEELGQSAYVEIEVAS